ncbi:MAG: hypothetical protein VX254_03820, partial [Planctomycetota bacterium]|nr:hypothetical protein [Planctomycetota bacterium]
RFDYDLEANQAQPGDVNQDHFHDISDPMSILNDLFLGNEMVCRAAGDVNSDSNIDLSDAVYMLTFLFNGGPNPSEAAVECTPADGGGA